MASKQIIDRERSSRSVISMLTQYSDRMADGAKQALRVHYRKREDVPDLASFATALANMLEAATEELVAADTAHEQELGDDPQVRAERDEARSEAYQLVQTIRGSIEANYGDPGLRALGLWDPCPSTPQGTLTYARNLVKALRSNDVKLPKARTKHVKLQREDIADELEQASKRLDASMKTMAREEAEAKGTQQRKDQALAAYDATFRNVTSLGIGLFRMAGLGDIADKIRPSVRKAGVLEEPIVDDGGADVDTPAEDPPPA